MNLMDLMGNVYFSFIFFSAYLLLTDTMADSRATKIIRLNMYI